jgi:serpin B
MAMKNLIITGLAFVMACTACNKNEDPKPVYKAQALTLKEKSYVQLSNNFAFSLFQTFKDEPSTKNVFISPLSIQNALAMVYNGAETSTKIAFEESLRMNGFSRSEINEFYKKVNNNLLASDSKINLSIANSIWYNQDYTVVDSFIAVNQNYYNADVRKANFKDAATISNINGWVNDKTKGKISSIIDEIPEDAVMYLINALYFNGTWKYAFDKSKTSDYSFLLPNSTTVNCKMMQQKGAFNYMANEKVKMVELPYGNGNYNMYVLVPQDGILVGELAANLTDANWKTWTSALQSVNVTVKLPRFKFSWGREINPEMKQMGLGIAFSDNADFSGIVRNVHLAISKVIHKTYIDVYEEGTEAAAVTAVEVGVTSVGPNEQGLMFVADKPFVFVIQEKTTGCVLFMGQINNPTVQ